VKDDIVVVQTPDRDENRYTTSQARVLVMSPVAGETEGGGLGREGRRERGWEEAEGYEGEVRGFRF